MPGSSSPSRNSREAPPPVEMWVILSAKPSCSTAAAESPPPMMEMASLSAMALATAMVPPAKGCHFKHAHGAVPHHGAGVLHRIGEQLLGFGADVQTHPAVVDIPLEHLGVGVHVKGIRRDVVHRQQEPDALGFGLLEDFPGQLLLVRLADLESPIFTPMAALKV